MGQKVTVEMDVVTEEQFSRLGLRVAALEGSHAAVKISEVGRSRRLDLLTERVDALSSNLGAVDTNVADHEREITLLRTSVQNIQKWIAERAVEKHAASAQPEDAPPNAGPAVARACPKGTTKVWLALTKEQAEDLLKLVGNVQGHGARRDRTYDPIVRTLVDEVGVRFTTPEHGSTIRVERGSV